eukprot:3595250-Rhodomonas_salina.4
MVLNDCLASQASQIAEEELVEQAIQERSVDTAAMPQAPCDDVLQPTAAREGVVSGLTPWQRTTSSEEGHVAKEKSVMVVHMVDIVAASLAYNNLSAADGYDAFDDDMDGVVSLTDLRTAVELLQLNLEEAE